MPSTDAPNECPGLFRVLGDRIRLAVVRRLMDGPCHVNELNEGLGVDQSLLSHHLRVLRESGLVTAQRDGKAVRYRLNAASPGPDGRTALELGCCRIQFREDACR